jgi:cold shock CspA family protein
MPSHAKSKTSPAICAVRSRSTRRKATVGWQSFWAADECGFVETADGREIYFHRNAVLDGAYRRLRGGSEVRFVERKGRTRSTVRLIGKHHLV